MKKEFSKLTKAEKRVAVAKDVLARIKTKNITPVSGTFFCSKTQPEGSIKNELKNNKCGACAKGSLFLSFIGFTNKFNFNDFDIKTSSFGDYIDDKFKYFVTRGEELNSDEMKRLSVLFSRKQLSVIETAYEGSVYYWNEEITNKEENACMAFYDKHNSTTERLTAICNNIIKNKGTFAF